MSKYVFDKQKWQNLTIFEQMGNIGQEVGRAFAARRRGDTAAMTGAWQRGLDLLDATAEQLARQKSPKLREVLRARELFAGMEDESLEDYFMWFAIAARKDRQTQLHIPSRTKTIVYLRSYISSVTMTVLNFYKEACANNASKH